MYSLTDSELKQVVVPPFAESITEGDLRWIKEIGDHVAEDEAVAEVETDKVCFSFILMLNLCFAIFYFYIRRVILIFLL